MLIAHPSPKADLTFAYLQLEQAMRRDDVAGVQEAARTLLRADPQSRPLADATGWLLGNRYSEQARNLLDASVAVLPTICNCASCWLKPCWMKGTSTAPWPMLQAFADAHPDNASARVELALLYLKADGPPKR